MRYWYTYPELLNRENLVSLVDSGFSVEDISRAVGCSVQSVRTALDVHGVNYAAARIRAKRRGMKQG